MKTLMPRGVARIVDEGGRLVEPWHSYFANIQNAATSLSAVAARVAALETEATERITLAAIFEDRKNSGVDGGDFVALERRVRDLNAATYNPTGIVLSGNQFTLPAGEWIIESEAPAVSTAAHQSWIRNTTSGTDAGIGSSEFVGVSVTVSTVSRAIARVTLASPAVFQIEHRCGVTSNGNGFGAAASFGPEIYTRVKVHKVLS